MRDTGGLHEQEVGIQCQRRDCDLGDIVRVAQADILAQAILAQAILFKPLLLTRRGRFTAESLLSVLLRPRQPLHGAQGMDFNGRSQWVGPDPPRAATEGCAVAKGVSPDKQPTQQVRQRGGPRQGVPRRQSGAKPAADHVPPMREVSRPPEVVA